MNVNDSLFEDPTGHAVDFFEDMEHKGFENVFYHLHVDEWETWIGWGTPQLMAVEALAAAGGKPASSDECHYLVEFGQANSTNIDKITHDRMLHVIDQVLEKIKSDPEAVGLEASAVEEVIEAGTLMRDRVAQIEPSGEDRVGPKGVRDPRTGELRDPRTGEVI